MSEFQQNKAPGNNLSTLQAAYPETYYGKDVMSQLRMAEDSYPDTNKKLQMATMAMSVRDLIMGNQVQSPSTQQQEEMPDAYITFGQLNAAFRQLFKNHFKDKKVGIRTVRELLNSCEPAVWQALNTAYGKTKKVAKLTNHERMCALPQSRFSLAEWMISYLGGCKFTSERKVYTLIA